MIEADLSQHDSNSPVYKKVRNQREFLNIFLLGGGEFGHRQHTWRISCENGGRDWGSDSISQRIPVIASKPPEAGKEGQNRLSLTADGRNQLYDTRILDFYPPIYRDNILLLVKPSSLWCFVSVALAN